MSADPKRRDDSIGESWWREWTPCEEDKLRFGFPLGGYYRWFRSPNVVPIEQGRKRREGKTTPVED